MIIDMQIAYFNKKTEGSMGAACEYINAIIPSFRSNGLPIIWIQNQDEDDGASPGKEGFEIVQMLKPQENDYRITKEYGNSFNKTKCSEILKKNNIDTVVITGFCAEYCVLSTYRGALDLDLVPVILRNGICSGVEEHVSFVERISNIASLEVVKKLIAE
jgi:nicotinamidase-related amidase